MGFELPAADGSGPRGLPATAHVQPRVRQDKFVLQTQHEVGRARAHPDNPKGIVASSPRLPSLRGYLGSRSEWNQPQRGCGECRAASGNEMAANASRLAILVGW